MSLLKSFNCRKEACAMQKLFIKNGQVYDISKTMGTQMPAMKKEKDDE
jgi:hypothetical protein